MAGKIFINYRRDDSIGMAGRLHDRLAHTFGRAKLFMDVDHIPAGTDFVAHLNGQVAECHVVLVVIGPNWLGVKDESGGRRLDNPDDFVAIEIAAALARDIRVIPVLVDGARMPKASELPDSLKPLARRQAVDVRHAHFGHDAEALVARMREALGDDAAGPRRWRVRTAIGAAAVAVLLLIGWSGYAFIQHMLTTVEQTVQQREAELKAELERQARGVTEAEAKRKSEEAEQQRLAAAKAEEVRQARAAAEAEAKRKSEEAEQQRVAAAKAEEERQARAAAEAETKRKSEEAEQQRVAAAKAEEERQARAAAEAEAKRKSDEAEQQRVAAAKAEEERQARARAEAEAKRKSEEAEQQRVAAAKAEEELQARAVAEFEATRKVTEAELGQPAGVNSRGARRGAWIGVTLQRFPDQIAERLNITPARGALVVGVAEDGPAKAGGIDEGDVIIKFDGKDCKDQYDLPHIVADTPVGKEVQVTLIRNGAEYTKTVKIGVPTEEEEERLKEKARSSALVSQGDSDINTGDHDRAIADYDEAIRLDPKNAVAFVNRGIAYERKGDCDRAIADFSEAVRLDAKNAAAFRDFTYGKKGENAQTITDCNEALRLSSPSHSGGSTVASTTPSDTKSDRHQMPPDLPRQLQSELKRVGCKTGDVGSEWNASARKALSLFNDNAGTKFDAKIASLDALDAVRGRQGRVCPLECERGSRVSGDRCVKISCDGGYAPGANGGCEKRSARERERRATPQHGAKCFIANGASFCE